MCNDFTHRARTVIGEPVLLRALTAEERRLLSGGESPFALIGRVAGGDLELWKANGRWREDDSAHPRDLDCAPAISTPHP